MRVLTICNKIIEYSFYALFFITPLVFTSVTSELFEFNKMWFVYAVTIVIATTWICKMIFERKILIQKTPLDIPIFLFLLSQIISTIISLDTHLSLWGYYSRFNGGLLSTISFILLYYALVSNNSKEQKPLIENPPFRLLLASFSVILFLSSAFIAGNAGSFSSFTFFISIFFSFLAFLFSLPQGSLVMRLLITALFSGLLVAAWGLPSHFGYDPTCLLFRQSLDVSCWTSSFQPMVRIFSTLGQPNWLAAFLSVLIPISLAMGLSHILLIHEHKEKYHVSRIMYYVKNSKFIHTTYYLILTTLFFAALLFTNSRSGFLGLAAGLFVFFGFLLFLFIKTKNAGIKKFLIITLSLFAATCLIFGTPFTPSASSLFNKVSVQKPLAQTGTSLETGGTESGKIRLIVWKGALDVFAKNPLFGSGVETFAFSYYQNRPAEHNLTSEWDYLYNKAHNEYLNYLATTGIFGLGSYLLIIGWFLFVSLKEFKVQNAKLNKEKLLTSNSNFELLTLSFALIASYVTILVSNFLGFSVVIINLYFFLIPAFSFLLLDILKPSMVYEFSFGKKGEKLSFFTVAALAITILIGSYFLLTLFRFWIADTIYSYGSSLSKAGQYVLAQENLQNAVLIRSDEPVFQDDLAYNTAVLALVANSQGQASESAALANSAITLSNNLIKTHPNYLTFLKTQVRLLYVLSQIDPKYLSLAATSIERAQMLAPTDAKVAYTAGVLYGQTGDLDKGIAALEKALTLKPDYSDGYFALALLYREKATNDKGQVVNPADEAKAVSYLHYILSHFDKNDKQATETLKAWKEQ